MSAEVKKEIHLEIAHVLFIDIVGYSKRLINEQRRRGSAKQGKAKPRRPRRGEQKAAVQKG
jgi:hypothetical protein